MKVTTKTMTDTEDDNDDDDTQCIIVPMICEKKYPVR